MTRTIRVTLVSVVTVVVLAVIVGFVVAALSVLGVAHGLLLVAGVSVVLALLAWLTPLWSFAITPDSPSSWLRVLPAMWRWALRGPRS